MKTNHTGTPTVVAFELELELRQTGQQLSTSRVRMEEADRRAAAAQAAAHRADGLFKAVHSAVTGGLGLAGALGPLSHRPVPEKDLAVAKEAWGLVGRFTALTEADTQDAKRVVDLIRARARAMEQDASALDADLDTLRALLLRMRET